jgi:hypothetical protein
MRTTVRLDDALFRQVKHLAAKEETTLTSLIDQALREMLHRREQLRESDRAPLPTFRGRGLQPGVDLDDAASLLELMEGRQEP